MSNDSEPKRTNRRTTTNTTLSSLSPLSPLPRETAAGVFLCRKAYAEVAEKRGGRGEKIEGWANLKSRWHGRLARGMGAKTLHRI